jgi:hypothetical protein
MLSRHKGRAAANPTGTTETPKTDLLADYLDLETFARREVKRHPRTVRRWLTQPDGLPYVRLGSRTLIHIPTAKAWLLSRMRQPNPRRDPTA